MKINPELTLGLLITVLSLYYWIDISGSALSGIPTFFRFTYRLFPYFDWLITGAGLWMLYAGINKLRK